ncbi:unnamed protein product [Discosporangium mesarthrocarpum]
MNRRLSSLGVLLVFLNSTWMVVSWTVTGYPRIKFTVRDNRRHRLRLREVEDSPWKDAVDGDREVSGRPLIEYKREKKAATRIDEILVARGIASDLKHAAALIMAGNVFIRGDAKVLSPATKIDEHTILRVRRRKTHTWASRGGIKLHHAINHFDILPRIRDAVAIDVGCSTGGFTDVLLSHGAQKVYSVDVGYGLLDYRLRQDKRVKLLERTNARDLDSSLVPEADGVDILVCDASFISLEVVLPAGMKLVKQGGLVICLIKPQFQATRDQVQGGLVSDPAVHDGVCAKAQAWLESLGGWQFMGITESPIRGAEMGNTEFLMCGKKNVVQ